MEPPGLQDPVVFLKSADQKRLATSSSTKSSFARIIFNQPLFSHPLLEFRPVPRASHLSTTNEMIYQLLLWCIVLGCFPEKGKLPVLVKNCRLHLRDDVLARWETRRRLLLFCRCPFGPQSPPSPPFCRCPFGPSIPPLLPPRRFQNKIKEEERGASHLQQTKYRALDSCTNVLCKVRQTFLPPPQLARPHRASVLR